MLVQAPETTRVFDRIVCGVDSSPESLEAARQADRLRSSEGLLRLATVADVNVAVHAGYRGDPCAGRARCSGTGRASQGGRRRPPEQHAPPRRRPGSRPARRAAAVGCDARLGRATRTQPDARDAARRHVDGAAPRRSVLGSARAQAAIRALPVEHPLRCRRLGSVACRRRSGEDRRRAIRLRAGLRRGNRREVDRSRPDPQTSARTSSTISAGRSRRWSIFRTRRTWWSSAAVAFTGLQRSEA